MFDTVLIAGLGLMGGSMGKTIKARTLSRVLGWNRTRATAEQALADGAIDAIASEALFKEPIWSLSACTRRRRSTGCSKTCPK